jgi:hypothetical protein
VGSGRGLRRMAGTGANCNLMSFKLWSGFGHGVIPQPVPTNKKQHGLNKPQAFSNEQCHI